MDQLILLRSRVPEQEAQGPPRDLSGADGQEGGSLIPQGPEWPATVPVVFHAAGSLNVTFL